MEHVFSHIRKANKEFTLINAIELVKETEKAVCLKCRVYWGLGKNHEKDMWFPKSVITMYDDLYAVAEWFYEKTAWANRFKGYEMNFELSACADVELQDGKYVAA